MYRYVSHCEPAPPLKESDDEVTESDDDELKENDDKYFDGFSKQPEIKLKDHENSDKEWTDSDNQGFEERVQLSSITKKGAIFKHSGRYMQMLYNVDCSKKSHFCVGFDSGKTAFLIDSTNFVFVPAHNEIIVRRYITKHITNFYVVNADGIRRRYYPLRK